MAGSCFPQRRGRPRGGVVSSPKGSGDTEEEHRKGAGDDSERKLNPVSGTQHRKPFHEDFAHSFLSLACSFQRFLLEIFPLSGPGLVLLQRFVLVGVSKARNECRRACALRRCGRERGEGSQEGPGRWDCRHVGGTARSRTRETACEQP